MSISSGHVSMPTCLGFCGRTTFINESNSNTPELSRCGACPWGERANKYSICEPCETPLTAYDWMYLLFIALLPLLLHMQFIRSARKYCRSRHFELSEHICVLLENTIACITAILAYPPRFSFVLNGCEKTSYKEWYPASHNPTVEFTKPMRCSYEVVFPLYSIVFLHHLILIFSMFILRSTLYCLLLHKLFNGKPYYYGLLSLPLLVLVHGTLSGFLYIMFPWILLTGSIFAMVYHLALEGKRSIREMIVRLFSSTMHILFLIITTLLLIFSLIALVTYHNEWSYRWHLLWFVPAPFVSYLFTMPFSHPSSIPHAD